MVLWRLSNSDSIYGNDYPGGRWLPAGTQVVLLDASPLAAVCARLALVEASHPGKLPQGYRLLEVQVPEPVGVTHCQPVGNWVDNLAHTRELGDAWFSEGEHLLLRVPTVSGGYQYLLNCMHPGAVRCKVLSSSTHPFDEILAAAGTSSGLSGQDWLARP